MASTGTALDGGAGSLRPPRRAAGGGGLVSQARHELLPLCAVLLAIVAWCYPAFTHGFVYGSYDEALSLGLSAGSYTHVHNYLSSDQIYQDAAWLRYDQLALRHLQLPLWNPYNALGAPQFPDFQSGVLSLPSLVAYLVPLGASYTVQTLVKLALAGTGTYVAARVLGTSRTGATLAGIVGELAGPLAGWAGWPQMAVADLTGWLIAAAVLVVRRPRSRWPVVLLGVVTALALYGGFPELFALVGIGVAVFEVVFAARSGRWWRSQRRLATGVLAGIACAAPLWLPGLVLLRGSAAWGRTGAGQPLQAAIGLLTNGYFGSPVTGSTWFGPLNYYETAAFVGVPVLVLALVALVSERRSAAITLGCAAAVLAWITYGLPLSTRLLQSLPGVRGIADGRGVLVLDTLLALLAGIGLDEAMRWAQRRASRASAVTMWGGLCAAALAVGYLAVRTSEGPLPALDRSIRLRSLVWPAVLVVVTAGALLAARARPRLHWGLGAAMVLAEAAFLVSVGAPLNTWGRRAYPTTSAIRTLRAKTGGRRVAVGANSAPDGVSTLGLLPDTNMVYRVPELALYDDDTPRSLEQAWTRYSGASSAQRTFSPADTRFEPAVTTAAQARLFGVSYVLFPAGAVPPPSAGFQPDGTVGGEVLEAVPSASSATFHASATDHVLSQVSVSPSGTALVRLSTARTAWLDLRLTNVPGWHASVAGGRAVPVKAWKQGMLRVRIPAGARFVRLRYWPSGLTAGLVLAVLGVATLLAVGLSGSLRSTYRRGSRAASRCPRRSPPLVTGPSSPGPEREPVTPTYHGRRDRVAGTKH